LKADKNGRDWVYVVSHGAREAIDIFELDARAARPTVQWKDCVIMPAGVEPNSAVVLADGGLLFTTLYDPGETDWPKRIGQLAKAAPSGAVYEWHKESGFTRIAVPPMSGPNGIELSPDEKTIFLAGWADGVLWRVDRTGKATAPSIKMPFLPDNLHWAPDHTLLVAGQPDTVGNMFACNMKRDKPLYCSGWAAATLDTRSMKLRQIWQGKAGAAFGDSTAALLINSHLWIGSINGDRLAIVHKHATKP
jgi:hypothetical protein